ncbi:hypothetical protein DY000_02008052 [Brassica cretica]|uniref:Uncharacterized protein n=1 Tax=Brassica cretica TaxID=69181 RepID=A0ABQ7C0S6_BRACR|nr:hypothetical protein DY000_02008052 [Brassica cretica]
MPKLDEWTEKLEVARSMRSGRGGKFLACTRWNGQARDVVMHATESCGLACGGRGVSLHGARPCIQEGRGRGVILHETETCSLPCGARGVAAHASGAMRSDTRADTRLESDWLLMSINSPRSPLVSTHPEHIKHLEKVLFKLRGIRSSGDQFKNSLDVGLLEKVEKEFGSQKSGSRYLEVGSWQEAGCN